jgi:hypothetical protein
MAHIGRPKWGVAFTERKDPDGNDKHLKICIVNDSEHQQRLILVCEDLYCDIRRAAKELLQKMEQQSWEGKKSSEHFMNPDLRIKG